MEAVSLPGSDAATVIQDSELMNHQEGLEAATRMKDDIQMVMDLPVHIEIELGRTKISGDSLLAFQEGSTVELDVAAGEPLSLVVNGCLIAKGELVFVNGCHGIRLTEIISRSERLRNSRSI